MPDTRTRETNHSSLPGWLDQAVRPGRAGHAVHAYMSTPSIMARRQATATPCLLGAGTCHEFHVALLGCSPRWARLTRRSVIMAWDLHAGERGVSSQQARERVPVRVHGRGRERERVASCWGRSSLLSARARTRPPSIAIRRQVDRLRAARRAAHHVLLLGRQGSHARVRRPPHI